MWVSKGSAESGVTVDMKQWFGELTLNIVLRMVGGKRYFGPSADGEEAEARRNQKVMRDFVCLFGVFVLSDAIPFLGWLDFNGYEKTMKRTAKELDILVGGWLEEHKQRRLLGGKEKQEQDFMDAMLNISEKATIAGSDTINKATCLNVYGTNHLGGGPMIRAWDQEVCSLCGFMFEPWIIHMMATRSLYGR